MKAVLEATQDNGLMFDCPGCGFLHAIHHGPGAGSRWEWNGSMDKPTFLPSVLVQWDGWIPPAVPGQPKPEKQALVPCVCHSFITDGNIQFLGDCTHALAGQTVPLPEIEL